MNEPAFGIELLSVFALPPLEFIELAAALDCRHISLGLTAPPFNPENHPFYSLRDDAALRRDVVAALRHHGVSLSLGEGFAIRAGGDVDNYLADLDLMRELGVERINTVCLEPDAARGIDQLGRLAELVAVRGQRLTLEFAPGLPIGTLDTAVAAIAQLGRSDVRLLLDTMHVLRSGATPAAVAALGPDLIDYIQLSDAPLQPTIPNYMQEATFHRLPPGEGELPLADLLAALPTHERVVSLEIPMLEAAQRGIGPRERLTPAIAAARRLLTTVHARQASGGKIASSHYS